MISRDAINDIGKTIAECFNPDKIVLFGSYAWGKPDQDSDLDLIAAQSEWDAEVGPPDLIWINENQLGDHLENP